MTFGNASIRIDGSCRVDTQIGFRFQDRAEGAAPGPMGDNG
jgi:hypothetical protein